MAFEGNTHEQIGAELDVNPNTITNWRKTDIWKKTESRLVDNYIDQTIQKGTKVLLKRKKKKKS